MKKSMRLIGGVGMLTVLAVGGRSTTATDEWWTPTPGTSWQIQLNGAPNTRFDVEVYAVDLWETPQKTIDVLHAQGR